MTSPRYDWWQVQAIHPDKKEPFDVYINRFPTLAQAEAQKLELEKQGYENINIIEPDAVRRNPRR